MLPHFYVDVPALRSGTVGGYVLALASIAVATALRLAVDPYVVGVPFATFWPAVIITALISGVGAGLFCVALSAAAAVFFAINHIWLSTLKTEPISMISCCFSCWRASP
jgi:hypothetical protein